MGSVDYIEDAIQNLFECSFQVISDPSQSMYYLSERSMRKVYFEIYHAVQFYLLNFHLESILDKTCQRPPIASEDGSRRKLSTCYMGVQKIMQTKDITGSCTVLQFRYIMNQYYLQIQKSAHRRLLYDRKCGGKDAQNAKN